MRWEINAGEEDAGGVRAGCIFLGSGWGSGITCGLIKMEGRKNRAIDLRTVRHVQQVVFTDKDTKVVTVVVPLDKPGELTNRWKKNDTKVKKCSNL